MGKALYRKYRSKSLAEIIGQEHITTTLENALKNGTISHAYLLTGPRGVGKTSVARILAYEVNGLPYHEEQSHLDIIEIDAASNRRIDEIRELKDRVHIAPTSAKYKVYIIDEVHMLTREAFNALLKTLEEPPAHVIFILATTEAHKVPETIISRTQRFTFKPVAADKVINHLKDIAKKEHITIDEPALELIAAHGEGSFRDSISLLDQLRHLKDNITVTDVRQALGQAAEEALTSLLHTLRDGNISAVAAGLVNLQDQGIQPAQIARQLSHLVRSEILNNQSILPVSDALRLLHELVSIPAATDPGLKLELALYDVALLYAEGTGTITEDSPKTQTQPLVINEKSAESATKPRQQPQKTVTALNSETWPIVLAAIKAKHTTLYGITRMAVPTFRPGKLTLTFAFAFHQKRLSDSKNQQTLLQIIEDTTGEQIILECLVDTSIQPEPLDLQPATKSDSLNLQTISNIFGSAEVVE